MIRIVYNNSGYFVYNVNDWFTLRSEYRIVGDILGSTNFIPSLPCKLHEEEVALLLEKNLVEVYESVSVNSGSSQIDGKQFKLDLLKSEQLQYKKLRRAQLELMIDKIVANRRKHGDNRCQEEILEEELVRSCVVTEENMLWPIFLQENENTYTKRISAPKYSNNLKCAVYKDLWDRGYWITDGEKFGGDFIAYLGDPLVFHSIFIIRCVEADSSISATEIVAFGRLGVSVRKRAVLASMQNGQLSYLTINWIDG